VGNARRFARAVHRIARSAKAGIGAADCPQIHRPGFSGGVSRGFPGSFVDGLEELAARLVCGDERENTVIELIGKRG
jgi:hypothetical protein